MLASEYWRGRNGNGAPPGAEEEARRHSPPADPHSNTSTPLVDELPAAAGTRDEPAAPPAPARADTLTARSVTESEAGEEVDESKWQDRIAFRFDQIISFASTAMEDKRRRSDEECNTSPDLGIGHGETGAVAAAGASSLSSNLSP